MNDLPDTYTEAPVPDRVTKEKQEEKREEERRRSKKRSKREARREARRGAKEKREVLKDPLKILGHCLKILQRSSQDPLKLCLLFARISLLNVEVRCLLPSPIFGPKSAWNP